MEQKEAVAQKRKRSGDRISEIVDLAEAQILAMGTLPLSIQAIADAMGSSRALVYAYFSDQNALIDAVLMRAIRRLDDAGFTEACRVGDAAERLVAATSIYLDHVVEHGPVLHHIGREVPRAVTLSPAARGYRARMIHRLAGALKRDLSLPPREALILVELLAAIPEELARLIRRDELSIDDAHATNRRLVLAGIDSLRPTTDGAPV
ncbi:MAG: TetR/AcrR family transcriptional regulator [Alphaproteobacteria bacterium HGW-Alphaproteobacteria-16]|nr:MAG: TetR/AcrR family transcriptional regulator [Alphaproteobacteria bacterium HGW-Alphaproteobacteria-16]